MPPRRDGEVEPGVTHVCVDCGDSWFLPNTQAAWFTARGWVTPRRCEPCRLVKRQRRPD
jgi:Probable zinc-ribbon domain